MALTAVRWPPTGKHFKPKTLNPQTLNPKSAKLDIDPKPLKPHHPCLALARPPGHLQLETSAVHAGLIEKPWAFVRVPYMNPTI